MNFFTLKQVPHFSRSFHKGDLENFRMLRVLLFVMNVKGHNNKYL